jgi:hypothetical protein
VRRADHGADLRAALAAEEDIELEDAIERRLTVGGDRDVEGVGVECGVPHEVEHDTGHRRLRARRDRGQKTNQKETPQKGAKPAC